MTRRSITDRSASSPLLSIFYSGRTIANVPSFPVYHNHRTVDLWPVCAEKKSVKRNQLTAGYIFVFMPDFGQDTVTGSVRLSLCVGVCAG